MSDTTQADATANASEDTTPQEEPAPGIRFKIKVAKADAELEVQWNVLSDEVKMHVIEHGLSKLLNAATAKTTKTTDPDPAEMKAKALAFANKKLDSLKRGEVGRKKSSKGASGKVMTEARRLAKLVIKAAIKKEGLKISDYEAKEITEMANEYITENPEIVQQAQASIDAAEAVAGKSKVDTSKLKPSAKKVAAREAKNAASRKDTADKAAGKPGPQKSQMATRAKPRMTIPAKPQTQPSARQ